jgi:hypothetical protein
VSLELTEARRRDGDGDRRHPRRAPRPHLSESAGAHGITLVIRLLSDVSRSVNRQAARLAAADSAVASAAPSSHCAASA